MSSKIRVLDEHTINKIAAGEVIENPASVVKELVENSLDAGSTEITVEIRGGGRQLIRISDNGCGMIPDDALLCLERHATSKIRDVEDIFCVGTMGFRGEAIPSIASISKFTLLTCPHDKDAIGTMLNVEGGKVVSMAPALRAPGTTIEVKSLFFNVPVRMKFQRSPTYDANEILKVLSIIALGNPTKRIEMINNGKVVLSALPALEDALEERVRAVLGDELAGQCCPIDEEGGRFKLEGVVGLPANTKANRTGQYLFINRRPVSSPLVSFAVREGYGTMLSTNRHPVFVLYLTLPGDLVDVNVHPQKREVRLRQDEELRRFIIQSIDRALHATGVTAFTESCIAESPRLESESDPVPFSFAPMKEPFAFVKPSVPQFAGFPIDETPLPRRSAFAPEFSVPSFSFKESVVPVQVEQQEPVLFKELTPIKPLPKVMGTIPRFVLIEREEGGISLIDQRAAHARVIFEKMMKQEEGKEIEVQSLLIPHTVETTVLEALVIREQIPFLNGLGIQLKEFGQNSFLIDGLPAIFGNIDVNAFVADLLHAAQEERQAHAFHKETEKRVAILASRVAMRATKKLSIEEARGLVAQLMECEKPFQCPAGKPTIVHLSENDLIKQFTRG